MDNDAFRTLVRDRAKVKSTKEIAREAVEAEFKRGKKKRSRSGDSSGGSDNDNDNDNDERRKHKKGGERRGRDNDDEENDDKDAATDSNYRDRAKERREGKIDATTISKELEKFTSGSTPTPIVARKAAPAKKKERLVADAMPTLEEAKDCLHKFTRAASSRSEQRMSSGLSGFIRLLSNRFTSAPASTNPNPSSHSCATAKAIQRSRLIMSVDGVANDYRRAWQVPKEITHPNPNFDKYFRPRLDLELVMRIEKVVSAKKRLGIQSIKVNNSRPDNDNDNSNVSPSRTNADSTNSDEDEDIFGGVGI
jgi:hypothetical protein